MKLPEWLNSTVVFALATGLTYVLGNTALDSRYLRMGVPEGELIHTPQEYLLQGFVVLIPFFGWLFVVLVIVSIGHAVARKRKWYDENKEFPLLQSVAVAALMTYLRTLCSVNQQPTFWGLSIEQWRTMLVVAAAAFLVFLTIQDNKAWPWFQEDQLGGQLFIGLVLLASLVFHAAETGGKDANGELLHAAPWREVELAFVDETRAPETYHFIAHQQGIYYVRPATYDARGCVIVFLIPDDLVRNATIRGYTPGTRANDNTPYECLPSR